MRVLDIIAGFLVLCAIGIWIILIVSLIKKKQCGAILVAFLNKESKLYIVIGIVMALICLSNLLIHNNFSLSLNIMTWVVYPTAAIELIYFGSSKIQLRENGIICNAMVTRYADIESYRWEDSGRLVIIRKKGLLKKVSILIHEQNKEKIMESLDEKVKN